MNLCGDANHMPFHISGRNSAMSVGRFRVRPGTTDTKPGLTDPLDHAWFSQNDRPMSIVMIDLTHRRLYDRN